MALRSRVQIRKATSAFGVGVQSFCFTGIQNLTRFCFVVALFLHFLCQLPYTADILESTPRQDSIQEPSPFTKSETACCYPNNTNSRLYTRDDDDEFRRATRMMVRERPPPEQAQDPMWYEGYTFTKPVFVLTSWHGKPAVHLHPPRSGPPSGFQYQHEGKSGAPTGGPSSGPCPRPAAGSSSAKGTSSLSRREYKQLAKQFEEEIAAGRESSAENILKFAPVCGVAKAPNLRFGPCSRSTTRGTAHLKWTWQWSWKCRWK